MRPAIYTQMLRQTAVYWPAPEPDGEGGRTFGDVEEIDCRWEDRSELFIDQNGNEVQSQAVVYVGQAVELGGVLFLGELGDLDSAMDPEETDEAYEIRGIQNTPDLAGVIIVRKVWL